MILQALVKHYETLADADKVSRRGWCHAKVSFVLNLSKDGQLKGIVPLKQEVVRGKKTVWIPQMIEVPEMVARSSGVSANFLCDNSKYLLGIDQDGSSKRVLECFEAAREKHLNILEDVHTEMSEAVKAFFRIWEPQKAKDNPDLLEAWEEITEGGNLIFGMGLQYAQDDSAIREKWEHTGASDEEEETGVCLVTGQRTGISRIHSTIKGVPGAQSSGAALVSFNAPAFESYGKAQSYNAPVGKYAAFAYTTALNYLLSQNEYRFQLGDTTVVFWAEDGKEICQQVFGWSVEPKLDNQETIRGVFEAIKTQRAVDIDGIEIDMEQQFYILGLAPNAARLSVRFFYQNSFGHILANIEKHYNRMQIVKPSWEETEYMGVWKMLQETVNQNTKDKKPIPNMAGMVLQSILSGGRYPASLYSNVMIRIRARQGEVTWGKAAIIKAYLIRNCDLEKGEDFMDLNENCNKPAYVLGCIFSVLEAIQEDSADSEINTTIRDRYFNSACMTPASVFPILLRLKNSHIKKMSRNKMGLKIKYEKQLTELMGKLSDFPKRLTLEEQGLFDLGYYHQVQKRYAKEEK